MHGISLEQQLKELQERSKQRLSREERWHNKARLIAVRSAMNQRQVDALAPSEESKAFWSNVAIGVTTVVVGIFIFIGTFVGAIPSMTTMVGGTTSGLLILVLLFLLSRR